MAARLTLSFHCMPGDEAACLPLFESFEKCRRIPGVWPAIERDIHQHICMKEQDHKYFWGETAIPFLSAVCRLESPAPTTCEGLGSRPCHLTQSALDEARQGDSPYGGLRRA